MLTLVIWPPETLQATSTYKRVADNVLVWLRLFARGRQIKMYFVLFHPNMRPFFKHKKKLQILTKKNYKKKSNGD